MVIVNKLCKLCSANKTDSKSELFLMETKYTDSSFIAHTQVIDTLHNCFGSGGIQSARVPIVHRNSFHAHCHSLYDCANNVLLIHLDS